MTVNQGLSSLVNSSPNFSNQALENAINVLKNISGGFITKTFEVDTAIDDNTVLTTTQKNDVKATINARPYLNFGRYLNDVIKHGANILNGSLVYIADPDTEEAATFLETLNLVHSLQSIIPNLYGVTAKEKNRGVDDHFGTLRGKLLTTDDSSKPVFTSLKETITFLNTKININAIGTDLPNTLDDLKNFLASVVGDSTDFQQTLDTFANAVKSDFEYIDLTLGIADPLGDERYRDTQTQLKADYEEIQVQKNLENSNLSNIRTYTNTLLDNISYTSLAEDSELADLMAKTSQTSAWIDYFENYKTRQTKLNPIYTVSTDSDKEFTINAVLEARGLPDVTDYVNLDAVATKTKKDSRIDTGNFDLYTSEQIITKSCQQLGITTANRSIYNQSKELLNNMNDNDRLLIANELDDDEATNTIS